MTPQPQPDLVEEVAMAQVGGLLPWNMLDKGEQRRQRAAARAAIAIVVRRCAEVCEESAKTSREFLLAARRDGDHLGAVAHNVMVGEANEIRRTILALHPDASKEEDTDV